MFADAKINERILSPIVPKIALAGLQGGDFEMDDGAWPVPLPHDHLFEGKRRFDSDPRLQL
jgi:hypothetical protein